MATFQAWIRAARLRTLPLSVSGVLMGSALAWHEGSFSWTVFILALATTLFLQVLSNLANDYGDSQNGADNTGRIGPERTVQSGAISPKEMRAMILLFVTLSFISGVSLITVAGIDLNSGAFYWLLGTGILAILAALFYTMGRVPYGYMALGDISVLLFFGYFSVLATLFLHTGEVSLLSLLPATAVGLLSVGVLNLNNMRDIENDLASGKRTLANSLGLSKARTYHVAMLAVSLAAAAAYLILAEDLSPLAWLGFLQVVPLYSHLRRLYKFKSPAEIDPELKTLAIIALLFTLIFGLGINV